MPVTRTQMAACFFAAVHLSLVALSACYIKVGPSIFLSKEIKFYQKASGADSSYGFFAPQMGVKFKASFDVVDGAGNEISDLNFESGLFREAAIRFGAIVDEFSSEEAQDSTFRQSLGKSLGAAVFTRYPASRSVVLHIKEYWRLSMEEYAQGKRAQWEEIYQVEFRQSTDSKLRS